MKKVVIMGASSGIGLHVAEALASRGVKVGLAARHTEPMKALKQKHPDCVEFSEIDVNSPDAIHRFRELISRLGGMDIYFHVSGIGYENLNLLPQREVEILETNAVGFARMISDAYRYFREHKIAGQIAAVTSVAGTMGMGRLSAYSTSKKCAQTYLTAIEQLAHAEHADITITDIRPGWINTPLLLKGHSYPMEMDLDYAVPLIIKAIVRHPRVAYIDWRWGLLASAWKMIPRCVWTRMDFPISRPDKPIPGSR